MVKLEVSNMRYFITVLFVLIFFRFSDVSAKDYHGSIAINASTGIVGATLNYATEAQAASKAIAQCIKKGGKKGCKTAINFVNACAAIAWSKEAKLAFSDWHDNNLDKARAKALSGCRDNGGVGCKILDAFCTSWETVESTLIWW